MSIFKDIYDILKDLIGVAKAADNQPLVQMAMEIQCKLFEFKEENELLKDKIKELQKAIEQNNEIEDIKKKLIPHSQPYYTMQNDKTNRYFCATCWNKNKLLIQLNISERWDYNEGNPFKAGNIFDCPNCKNHGDI